MEWFYLTLVAITGIVAVFALADGEFGDGFEVPGTPVDPGPETNPDTPPAQNRLPGTGNDSNNTNQSNQTNGTNGSNTSPAGLTDCRRNLEASNSEAILQQDRRTFLVSMIEADENAEEFYGHDSSSATGAQDIQRQNGSIIFLFQGNDGIHLVLMHGKYGEEDSGSASFNFSSNDIDNESWTVQDDLYFNDEGERAESLYDLWNVNQTPQTVHWTWGGENNDGGALNLGEDFEITVTPGFNQEARLYGQHYNGTVSSWQFISGSLDNPRRINLSMDEPVTICG